MPSAILLSLAIISPTQFTAQAYQSSSINDGWTFSYQNDTAATPIHLPHSWNSDAYHTRQYKRGTGTYTKTLQIPQNLQGRKIYLKFDGAATNSQILINGKAVGSHVGGYSPHVVDITPYVTPGQSHNLLVKVNNSAPDIPPYSADFTFMGGLYRDAWLINANPIHLDFSNGIPFKAVPKVNSDGTCSLSLTGDILNSSDTNAQISVEATLISYDCKEIASKTEKLRIRKNDQHSPLSLNFKDLKNIALWSPESPALYRVEISLKKDGEVIDTASESVGFRTFAFDETGRFLLNGKPYKLRGMCRHQDQAPMGVALTDEQHRRDMQMIKDLGANFIRISHYPQDDAVVEMCDRLGLIAWEEIPVIDYVPDSEHFADNSETMLREMIRSHYNHPSIVMWGYMNEILLRMPHENQEETKRRTLALANRLENIVREEDSSRLTTMAFHGSDIYNETGIAEITDVKGWNLYSGWYGGNLNGFEEYLSRQHKEHPKHKLIVSEYGAGSDMRLHSLAPEAFDFSMEYQQDYLEHYLPVIEDSTFVAGASHWNFIDFSSANRAESMPHINNKGLVTNDRRKKDVYHYYKAAWHDLSSDTVAYIASRDWSDRTDIIDESGAIVRPIKVYTNLPEIAMTVNGKSYGSKAVANYNVIFDVALVPGTNIIEISESDNSSNILDALTVNLNAIRSDNRVITLSDNEIAINVGSNCYFRSDESGLTWLPDREYAPEGLYGHISGKRSVSQDEIALTQDQPLLQHSLYGLDEYHLDVVPGLYEVELYFADLSSPSALSAYMLGHNAGNSKNAPANMDISINGKNMETGFSPAISSGVKTMVIRRYNTEVTGNSGLSIKFVPNADGSTLLSAIKVRKL